MRLILICCISLVALPAWAQKPFANKGDSLVLVPAGERGFCSPGIINKSRGRGVEIAYNMSNGGPMRPDESLLARSPGHLEMLEAIIVKLKVPLLNKPGFKLMAGFNYEPEKYYFSSLPLATSALTAGPNVRDVFNEIEARRLKQSAISLFALKPLDDKHYLGFRANAAFNGDYAGLIRFDDRYAAYQASVLYGIKKNDNFEYGFGVNFSHDFERTIALPFILYNRNFNDKWGIEAVFPASVQGRYNIDQRNIIMFGYQFNSQSYSIAAQNRTGGNWPAYTFSHSEILIGGSLERQIVPWVWFNMKAGLQLNMPTRFDAQAPDASSFRLQPAHAPYFRIGFFLSPPDKLCR